MVMCLLLQSYYGDCPATPDTFMFGFFEALELPSVLNGFEDRQSTLPKPILVDGVLSLVGHCLGLVVL